MAQLVRISTTIRMKGNQSKPVIIPRSLDIQAADVIREQILNGTLAPGTRLLEINLAEQFNLSRATIRSALQQLTYEGLVIQLPYKGCTVSGLSSQDAWELYTLRSALESLAARLAAVAITPSQVKELNAVLQQLVKAAQKGDWNDVANADFTLHKAIIQLAGHRRLQEQYKIVEQQIRLYIISCNALHPDLDDIIKQHRELVNAICSGDASTAEQIAQNHNTDGKALVEHLQEIEKQNSDLTKH
ncbi:GntR family transcriptional regulator [Brasilonema sp. UFV-L1]|uniref:GntR family transcriptional regulator n=1 Tax=Brasilonema sp. UFV-L1 TaxID=2234130 RepID=UPI001B7CF39C